MSSMTKISLLALIGAAAAHPSYGAHSKFHSKHSGAKPYPTGGWSGNYNTTSVYVPAGTASYDSYQPGKTSTIDITTTSTKTIYSTIYGTPSPSSVPQSAVVENVSSQPAANQCGPATVTVTAYEKATVTVSPGVSSAYSAGIPSSKVVVPSSKVIIPSSKAGESSYIVVSSTPAAATSSPVVASSKATEYSMYTPSASVPAITSVAQKEYSTAVASSTIASSSAAPTSSGTPTYSGGKRGLAYNDGELCSSFGSSFGFAYNWAQTESSDVGAPFIPMMHKPSDSTAEAWLANVGIAVKGGSKAVMGFNEPDMASQANMSPADACAAWKEYMNPVASAYPDVTILGPSVSNSGTTGQGLDWLSTFTNICSDAIVHATNIHFYDVYDEGTVSRFKAQVEKAASTYGKPVWITEFGLNAGSATEEQAASFLKEVMAYCDSSDSVQGYAYFMVGTGDLQLNTGSGLSTIGQVYASS